MQRTGLTDASRLDDALRTRDYVTENNPVRVIEAFIDELDLATVGFDGVVDGDLCGRRLPPTEPTYTDIVTRCIKRFIASVGPPEWESRKGW